MDQAQSPLEQTCLGIAKRHLKYALTDSSLGMNSREARVKKVHEFYRAILGNLGMLTTIQQWDKIVATECERSPLAGRNQRQYPLQEALRIMGITNNKHVFEVLEFSGAQPFYQENNGQHRAYVTAKDLCKIVNYLENKRAISHEYLQRFLHA